MTLALAKNKKMTQERYSPHLKRVESRDRASLENEVLTRGVIDVITREGLKERLAEGKPLRIKYGIDPTMRSAHIGHAVPIRKLRQFQELGHTAVFIIGDYTARIGDPTGRSEARKQLSDEEVKQNVDGYLDQAYKILDRDKTEIHLQSEWYGNFTLEQMVKLMSKTTYAQIMAHETFAKRVQEGKTLGFHEMLYPVMQAYDSVAVRADVELGGADQRFNFVLTRDIQRAHDQRPEEVILAKYLPGIDGQEKMSKSLGNTIDLLDSAENMFFKVMSMQDSLMPDYFELATDLPIDEIKMLIGKWKAGNIHPIDLKKQLARNIVSLYHSEDDAQTAERKFELQVQRKEIPVDVPVYTVSGSSFDLADILVTNGIVSSKAEVRRLVMQKGIKLDEQTIDDSRLNIGDKEIVIRVGKKKIIKIRPA